MTQKSILCYGDSNTWGFVPSTEGYGATATKEILHFERYSRQERWPGRLQNLLGDGFYVIEEGLNGRTTNINTSYPPDRNGKTYLASCLYSHAPIDLVILGLGSNDLKVYFNRNPEDICNGLAELVDIIQSTLYGPDMLEAPKILIRTPGIPLPIAETFQDEKGINVFAGAINKARKLTDLYIDLAKKKKCYLLDISQDILPSEIDGMHFDQKMHEKLASMFVEKVNEIFN